MNQTMHPCESCSMPIETGTYCSYCVTASGELQPFDERFEIWWAGKCAKSLVCRGRRPNRTLSSSCRKCPPGRTTRSWWRAGARGKTYPRFHGAMVNHPGPYRCKAVLFQKE